MLRIKAAIILSLDASHSSYTISPQSSTSGKTSQIESKIKKNIVLSQP